MYDAKTYAVKLKDKKVSEECEIFKHHRVKKNRYIYI
jgi:hypothetical protein